MNALIIAGGTLAPRTIMKRLASSASLIVCADGGANHARKLRLTPDIIVGDFDSVTPATRMFYRNILQIFDDGQESTDLEKALDLCLQLHISSVDVAGASGDRIDHTTGSLGCFRKYAGRITLRLIDTRGILELVGRKAHFRTSPGETISLIPLDRCTGITTTHLRYALKNEDLELGVREGISNEATARSVTISVKRGTLLSYRFHSPPK